MKYEMDVFIIIKYKVWLCRSYEKMEQWEYAKLQLTKDGFDYSSTVISAKEAKAIIAGYGMREKVNNEYGQVWEIPRKSFKRKFKGVIKI